MNLISRWHHRQQTINRKNKILLTASAALLLLLFIWLGYWLHQRLTHVSDNDAQIKGEMITLTSRVDGWLTQRPVIDGDNIKQGQLVAQIDERDARLRLAAITSNLQMSQAQIRYTQAQRQMTDQTTQAQLAQTQAQLASSVAALDNARHQLALAQANFHRDDSLLAAGGVARKNWDESHTTLLQRQSEMQQAQDQLNAQRAALANVQAQRQQLDVLDRQIEVQTKQTDTLHAQQAQIQQEINDRALPAPVTGVVDKTFANVGDYIQAGQWVMMVHDPKNLWVEANIKETEIADIAPGAKVAITVDAWPDKPFSGHVLHVGNAATNQFALLPSPNPSGNFTKITQRVPVRISLDSMDSRLKPGLMVEVSIDVSH
jgi:membrane fusion protein (multidrug efflux system)